MQKNKAGSNRWRYKFVKWQTLTLKVVKQKVPVIGRDLVNELMGTN